MKMRGMEIYGRRFADVPGSLRARTAECLTFVRRAARRPAVNAGSKVGFHGGGVFFDREWGRV
jgi:hypothetical protein